MKTKPQKSGLRHVSSFLPDVPGIEITSETINNHEVTMNNKQHVLSHYPSASLSTISVVGGYRLQLWPGADGPVFMAKQEASVWYDAVMYIGPDGDEHNEDLFAGVPKTDTGG